ncbi:clock-controlled protein 8 [Stemphylium lycopersici]|uniref:Clock-controlled protein 8 n=1 Tax=Stemphylium lycopersici TaxID=183478 RepID=A0A364NFT4_STELY|nr:clock-controlled protein 8 [Stemphylium lycopersici]RAR03711.1 clock-controlled protein 8 [Stemphylium lycopersici]RAR16120.1 clock-controlled protein 8 [Stemphylium lycopersici]
MEQERPLQRAPPPAYTQHEPESLHLPSVPTHIPTHNPQDNGRLPGIKSLDLPDTKPRHTPHNSIEYSPRSRLETSQWGMLPALNNATFPRPPEGLPREDVGSPMDTASVRSMQDDSASRRETSVSMDDPDVRLAAEALSGLGNPATADFVRSPTARSLTLSARSPTAEPPEPLLSLITSNHPWLGSSINGSISAYNTTKGYTPRLVQYGAELLERNIGSPMVNTVSSVGRRTGMEKSLRRYLGEGHRRPSDLEQGDGDSSRSKRQRIASPADDAMDVDDAIAAASRTRGGSQSSCTESLPAYDDQRSPNYEEAVISGDITSQKSPDQRSNTPQDRRVNWSTQLIMTTSGLGVALSETSLRSLKLCLGLLRSATTHIDSVMRALKVVLEEYETALRNQRQSTSASAYQDEKAQLNGNMASMGLVDSDKDDQVRRIADRIKALSSDIWTTLQSVVQSVSRYTGGALPQNAQTVVRTQLLSVPQRWQLAGRNASGDGAATGGAGGGEEVRGANRMLAFAKEGLDMMGQITTVVDGTVQSAESWLARIGRRPQGQGQGQGQGHGAGGEEKTPLALEAGVGIDEKR